MSWQDIVLAVGVWIFFLALLPSVLGKNKPAVSTSIITGGVLASFVPVYFSLSLWNSSIATSLLSITWFFLAWQKYRDSRKQQKEKTERD